MKLWKFILISGIILVTVGMFQWQTGLNMQKLTQFEEKRYHHQELQTRVESGKSKAATGLALLTLGALFTLSSGIALASSNKNRAKIELDKKETKIKGFECAECGHSIDENDRYCPSCGVEFTEDEEQAKLHCNNCGKGISDTTAKFCPQCGSKTEPDKKEAKIKGFECAECGHSIDENDRYCPSCGVEFTEDEEQAKLHCNNCGKEILKTTAKFCPQCGSNLI